MEIAYIGICRSLDVLHEDVFCVHVHSNCDDKLMYAVVCGFLASKSQLLSLKGR